MKSQLILSLVCGLAASIVYAEPTKNPQCEDPVYAEKFSKDYEINLDLATWDGQSQSRENEREIKRLQEKLVNAGVWSEQQAAQALFDMAKNPDVVALEQKREKISYELRVRKIALSTKHIVANSGKEKLNKFTCIFGSDAINLTKAETAANQESWSQLHSTIREFGKNKNVNMDD